MSFDTAHFLSICHFSRMSRRNATTLRNLQLNLHMFLNIFRTKSKKQQNQVRKNCFGNVVSNMWESIPNCLVNCLEKYNFKNFDFKGKYFECYAIFVFQASQSFKQKKNLLWKKCFKMWSQNTSRRTSFVQRIGQRLLTVSCVFC